jgi:propionyl-CoA carboxylase alpha chain
VPGQLWRPPTTWVLRIAGEDHSVEVRIGNDDYTVLYQRRSIRVTSAWGPGDRVFHGRVDDVPVVAQIQPNGAGFMVTHVGAAVDVQTLTPRTAELAALMPVKVPPDTSKLIMSPMPGLLLRLSVAVGDEVQEGQEVAMVEAMKMENILRAERPGVVKSVHAAAGDSLATDQIIVEFE